MNNIKKQVVNNAGHYAILNYIADVIGAVISIVIRRILGPTMMGIWTALTIVLNYCLYGNLGINGAMFKEIPALIGRGRPDLAEQTQNVIFTFTLLVGSVVSMLIFFASFFLKNMYPNVVLNGLRIIAVMVFLTLIYNFLLVSCRAYKKFIFLNKLSIVNEICTLVFVLLFVTKFKIYGMLAAVILSIVICISYALWYLKPKLHFQVDWKKLFYLIRLGLTLVIWGIAFNTLLSIDKIMAIKLLGPKALGFYSIAIMVFMFAFAASKRFGTIMFPIMQEEYCASNHTASLEKYVIKPNLIIAYLLPIFLGSFYLCVPVMVYFLLPQYINGILSFKILMVGCFFISLTPMLYSFLIAINKQIKLTIMAFLSVLITIGLSLVAVKYYHTGIEGIAVAAVISHFCFFLMLAFYCSRHFGTLWDFIGHVTAVLAPVLICAIILVAIDRYIKIKNIYTAYIIKQSIFIVAMLPMLYYINHKTGAIGDIWKHLIPTKLKFYTKKGVI